MCLSGADLMYIFGALSLAVLAVIYLDWRYYK
jgi:hypothetical protein